MWKKRFVKSELKMENKIKAVIDTNILISGTISPNGAPRKIIEAARDLTFKLVTTLDINEEVLDVLHRPKIYDKYHLNEKIVDDISSLLYEGADLVEGNLKTNPISADPDDDKFIIAAIESNSHYIVSGDKHLLVLKNYLGIEIVTANDFLDILELD